MVDDGEDSEMYLHIEGIARNANSAPASYVSRIRTAKHTSNHQVEHGFLAKFPGTGMMAWMWKSSISRMWH